MRLFRGGVLAVVVAVSLLASVRARAQGGTSSIEGRVADSQQLALADTSVEVLDQQGKSLQTIVGAGDGHYTIKALGPGTYRLQFSHAGFEPTKSGPVTVSDGQHITVDAILLPRQMTEHVTVTAPEPDRMVGSKLDIPPLELPVTVDTVPLEIIQQQNSTDIISVIENIPGANAWTQYGSLNYFAFRGFAIDHDPGSAILLNGLRQEGNHANSQINSVETVEVLKGPGSNLYGTEDTGGTINIVEKQPSLIPHYEVVLRGSRWGTGGVELGATGPLHSDNLLYRADFGYSHSDGFRGAGYDRINASPKIFWRISSRDHLAINFSENRDHFDGDAGIPLFPNPDNTFSIPDVNLNNRYNTPGNFEHTNYPVLQAFYGHEFSDNLQFRQAFQYQYIGDEYWQSEGLFIDPTISPLQVFRGADDFAVYFDHRDHAILSQSDLDGTFHLIWKHKFLIGYEYDLLKHRTRRSSDAQNTIVPPIDLFNPVETAKAVTSFPTSRFDGLRNQSNAVYFQDYVSILPKLQLLVGGRYDGYSHYDFRNPVGANGVETIGPHQNVFSQNPFTYRVGLNSQILPFLSLYTSWSTSFTAQQSLSDDGTPLKPEVGKQFEAGGRFSFFQNRLSLDADFFHIDQDNVDIERPNGDIEQAGEQYSQGVEVQLRGRVGQKLSAFATYGFTQTAFNEYTAESFFDGSIISLRGFVPGLVPKHTARAWTTYDLPKGFGVSLGGRYISRRATDQNDIFWMGGFTTFDAAIRYRRSKMEYSLNLSNVLNKTHYFISAIDDTQIYPGPPIDVSATIRYRF